MKTKKQGITIEQGAKRMLLWYRLQVRTKKDFDSIISEHPEIYGVRKAKHGQKKAT